MTKVKFAVVFVLMATGIALAMMEPPEGYVPGSSPTPPTGLSAYWESTEEGEEIHLLWDKHPESDLIGYIVYRSLATDYGYIRLNHQDDIDNDLDGETDETDDYELVTGTWYEDKSDDLDPDRVYYYRITAVIEGYFESNWSDPADTGDAEDESLFGCFIATAAFGSPLADEVEILQSFRDKFLIQNVFGREIVNCYYRLSPPLADFIQTRPLVKFVIRLHLRQVVRVVRKIMQ